MAINTNNLGQLSFGNSGLPFNAGTIAIKARRAPSINDKNFPYGQTWIDLTDSTPYMLTQVSNGQATWVDISGGGGGGGIATINSISPDVDGNFDLVSGNASVTFTPATNSIDLSVLFPTTEFIVGTEGKAQYTTIQDALDAANDASGGVVYVQPGTYTENLTLYDNVVIVGSAPQTTFIVGSHTPPDTGQVGFCNITIQAENTDSAIYSLALGTTDFFFSGCIFRINTGVVLAVHNWTSPAIASFYSCRSISQYDGWIENSEGTMDVFAIDSILGSGGAIAGGFMNGNTQLTNCVIGCDITFGGALAIDYVKFNRCSPIFNGATSGSITNTYFLTDIFAGYAASIETSNTLNISNIVVDTSAEPAFTCPAIGGTLNITNANFVQNNTQPFDFDVSTTVNWGSTETGELTTTHLNMPVTGAAAAVGTATLTSGVATVNTTAVRTASKIFVSYNKCLGTGLISADESDIIDGTSFIISSTDASDSISTINWQIIN